jgi:phage terminase large subunit-like protein
MWGREEKQLPPETEHWRNGLILGGRGAGKTRAGAEWVKAQALGHWTDGKTLRPR